VSAARLALVWGLTACSGAEPVAPETNEPPAAPAHAALALQGARRLTAAEYARTAEDLLGVGPPATLFPPDARNRGFTRNAAQIAESLFVSAVQASARELSQRATAERLAELAPCDGDDAVACAARFITEFGARSFRRPPTEDERARYLSLYELGAESGFAAGIALVLETMLQSAQLLYVSALGEATADPGVVRLAPDEIASELAYAVTGAPPDGALLELSRADALLSAAVREREARRLLALSPSRFQYRRFVAEWLGVDALSAIAKDLRAHPDFPRLREAMADELDAVADHVMIERGGALSGLLAGDFGAPPKALASFYGAANGATRPGRAGVLDLAGFLAVHAHPNESAPVLRGAAVLRRVLCRDLAPPAELELDVVFPAPDPNLTTRERFGAHVADPACAGCHAEIDAIGFTFENFDATGRLRAEDAGKPADTSGSVTLDGSELELADSVDLGVALASSREAERCFARQAYRYFSGRDDAGEEEAFVADADELDPARRAALIELAVLYVSRPSFVYRRREP
jgi:hypothetical protein